MHLKSALVPITGTFSLVSYVQHSLVKRHLEMPNSRLCSLSILFLFHPAAFVSYAALVNSLASSERAVFAPARPYGGVLHAMVTVR